ncbi:MAG: type II secretion system protein [Hyphomicrobiaceae bacterium]|nr:type II secretion system protein [Hyphomicrobiaceae bacterium]
MESRRNAAAGFTLIELMVTISVIMLLAGMLVPSIVAMREVFDRHRCQTQLGNIRMAIRGYSLDVRVGRVIPPSDRTCDDRTSDPMARGCYRTGAESLAHFLLGPDATGHSVIRLDMPVAVPPFYPAEEIRRSYAPGIGTDWLGLGYAELDDGYFGRVFVATYSTTNDADQAKMTRPILNFAARPTAAVGTNPYAIDDNKKIIENNRGGFDWAPSDYAAKFNEKMRDPDLGDYVRGFVLLSAGQDREYFTDDDIVDRAEQN